MQSTWLLSVRSRVGQKRIRCHIVVLMVLVLFGLVIAKLSIGSTLTRNRSCTLFVLHIRERKLLPAGGGGAKFDADVVEPFG